MGLYKVVKDGGVVVWVVGDQTVKGNETGTSFKQALYFKEIGFNLFDTMIYTRRNVSASGDNRGYWQGFDHMFVFSKGRPKTINLILDKRNKATYSKGKMVTNRRVDGSTSSRVLSKGSKAFGRRTNIWCYDVGLYKTASDKLAHEHPAIFPEKLVRDHIISWSNVGDLVYDPFMGSGTVGLVAWVNDRNYIGSEVSKKYCQIANKRIQVGRVRPSIIWKTPPVMT